MNSNQFEFLKLLQPDAALAVVGLHEGVVAGVPQLRRGQVWCVKCGATRKVNGAESLRSGWPTCCGKTMTIDSPEERASRTEGA